MDQPTKYIPRNTLTNGYRVLAHVTGLTERSQKECAIEAKFPYFRQGFVDLGLGRHAYVTDDIRVHTDGYALADARGTVVRNYSTYAAAVEAANAVSQLPPPEPQPEIGQNTTGAESQNADNVLLGNGTSGAVAS